MSKLLKDSARREPSKALHAGICKTQFLAQSLDITYRVLDQTIPKEDELRGFLRWIHG